MRISDLQYIESVDASEVQGAGGKWGKKDWNKKYTYKKAGAEADAEAQAFGNKTVAFTDTTVVADADAGFSGSASTSVAFAKS